MYLYVHRALGAHYFARSPMFILAYGVRTILYIEAQWVHKSHDYYTAYVYTNCGFNTLYILF